MKKLLLILLVLILIALGILAALFVLRSKPRSLTTPSQVAPSAFPVASSSPQQQTQQAQTALQLQDGSVIVARNFMNNGTTIEDPANNGTYYLQGSSGACVPDGSCPVAGTQTDFTIVYYSKEHAFVIGLGEEPLGEVRMRAEKYLQQTLGLTNDQMCKLNYSVGTTVYVNATYGTMDNLGFSFCPGAVVLP
jgi:hypothetical protein